MNTTSHPFAHDRAHVVAVAVMQIVHNRPHNPVHAVAAYLRDEFADVARQSAADVCGSLDEFLGRGGLA